MIRTAHLILLAIMTFARGRNGFLFLVLLAIALFERSIVSVIILFGLYLSCLMVRGFFGQEALGTVNLPSMQLVLAVLVIWGFVIISPRALMAETVTSGQVGAKELADAVFTIRREAVVDDSSLVASFAGAMAPFFALFTAFFYAFGLISIEQRMSSAETPVTRAEVKQLLTTGEAEPFWTRLVFAKNAWGVKIGASGRPLLVFGQSPPGLVDVYFSDAAVEETARQRVETYVFKKMLFADTTFRFMTRSVVSLRDEANREIFRGEDFQPVGLPMMNADRRFEKFVSRTHVAILSFPLFTPRVVDTSANRCFLFEI